MSEQRAQRQDALVVVGIDDSDGSKVAAFWAAQEAARRGAALRLASSYEVMRRVMFAPDVQNPNDGPQLAAALGQRHRDVAAEIVKAIPALKITSRVAEGHPVDVLLRATDGARLLVLSSRESGKWRHAVGSSVAFALAAHASAPVAVIRAGDDHDPSGPVVIGVDGSPNSEAVISFAFEEAALHGVGLVALHAWRDGWSRADDVAFGSEIGAEDRRRTESSVVSGQLSRWSDQFPDVVVTPVVVGGHPAKELIEVSAIASVVVVGSRGRGGFRGALLGSTSQALITHATCPVVVVRGANRLDLESY